MSKELIVSVNGREKKIAIIENDRVTEFYIERGEQNQGIVGNIYKGRVMRVLPGMQSAFVDIGLERDAFLYVSDFFDEEAEFERIVVDKPQKGDAATAAWAAAEHIEISGVERKTHPAVCIPNGARLILRDIPLDIQRELDIEPEEEVTFVQLGNAAYTYRDGVRFGNGREILLQRLAEGQRADVLSLALVEEPVERPRVAEWR